MELKPGHLTLRELSAPGRVLNGPAPVDSTMYTANPSHQVADGYMWMSGTSFAAPIVAGAANNQLANESAARPGVKGSHLGAR